MSAEDLCAEHLVRELAQAFHRAIQKRIFAGLPGMPPEQKASARRKRAQEKKKREVA